MLGPAAVTNTFDKMQHVANIQTPSRGVLVCMPHISPAMTTRIPPYCRYETYTVCDDMTGCTTLTQLLEDDWPPCHATCVIPNLQARIVCS